MIKGFSGEYRFLSNFWPSMLVYEGVQWPNVENPYQWYKTEQQELIGLFRLLRPGKAKALGAGLEIKGWLDRKFTIMYYLVRAKFEQNPDLAKKLLYTGHEEIVEFNTWGDTYWGVVLKDGKLVGKNRLGEILMLVRSGLRGEGLLL